MFRGPVNRRRAFSLAELVVAVGVLILLLALAGQIMSLTVKSTGQAKAITEVSQQLRRFEQKLRDDLAEFRPGEMLMVIQGNPINAYWTKDAREADDDGDPSTGYPHLDDPNREDVLGDMELPRADILMFFTGRRQVVYGHADLGEYTPDGKSFSLAGTKTFPPGGNYQEVFGFAAEGWHLARRSVLLGFPGNLDCQGGFTGPLNDAELLQGAPNKLGAYAQKYCFDEWVRKRNEPKTSPARSLPLIFQADAPPFARSQLDLTPPPTITHGMSQFFLQNCASFKVEWALDPHSEFVHGRLDYVKEILWFDPGALPPESPIQSLIDLDRALNIGPDGNQIGDDRTELVTSLFEDELGGFGPNNLFSLRGRFDPTGDWHEGDRRLYATPPERAYTEVFLGEPPPGGSTYEDEVRLYPGALRITVDVFDRERRLDRPVRRVIVARLGGED